MEAGLEGDKVIAFNQVGEAVFFADPSGPGAGQHVAKRRRGGVVTTVSCCVVDSVSV